jgi:predicted HAD superfamily Cof-like phosphohydrolase
MVKEFHETYGMPVGEALQAIPDERMELRWRLIHEEYLEVSAEIDNVLGDHSPEALHKLLKELADLVYVIEGFAVELGVDLDKVFEEVHRSNMSKLGADGKPIYREDGKVLKGPHYTEADIAKALEK